MICRKKNNKGILGLLDRIMLFSFIIPPGYIIYRFVRWYVSQDDGDDDGED
ncbi:MAG: hypothetical protein IPP57_10425 [Candidatus Obscuribacter sp.]|nr:hypothetical protein [Candidatus Obscuribacter sp.]MBK7837649.1 hypothetical protein [Candidatus Obscuribacter sp.]MBK9206469.1 hypothetical protein [Candidatus Obscuribacter sp.]MBK9618361.1 hypothetical protein [Candidatus Obscuribacter sp.]MBK9771224.1 hypothetical protein [Candidatus Obscuribacter sp.]